MARRNATILVVDADRRIHQACETAFDGFEVLFATGADEATAAYDANPVGAIVTELVLEGAVDGLTLVANLRKRDPGLAAVVLTESPSAQSAVRALRLGVDDYLIKHNDSMSRLKATVRDAIRAHTRSAEVERLLDELTTLNDAFLEELQALQRANLNLTTRIDAQREGEAESDVWRVLVVDDDVAIVALLETLLRSQGYDVEGANSGEEARSLFNESRYDVVITDKNLGDVDGVELIAEIRGRWPDAKVLLMTGFATLDSAVDAFHFGAVGYLRKPFEDLGVVIQRVEEVLADLQAERDEIRYVKAFRDRNGEFVSRYRLVKMKVSTLKRQK